MKNNLKPHAQKNTENRHPLNKKSIPKQSYSVRSCAAKQINVDCDTVHEHKTSLTGQNIRKLVDHSVEIQFTSRSASMDDTEFSFFYLP